MIIYNIYIWYNEGEGKRGEEQEREKLIFLHATLHHPNGDGKIVLGSIASRKKKSWEKYT